MGIDDDNKKQQDNEKKAQPFDHAIESAAAAYDAALGLLGLSRGDGHCLLCGCPAFSGGGHFAVTCQRAGCGHKIYQHQVQPQPTR